MSDKRVQLWCIYSAVPFAVLFLIGWVVLAGFAPPPSPMDNPAQIAAFYTNNLIGIRVGLVLSMFCSALLFPWGGAVNVQIMRIEGSRSPLQWGWIAAQGCIVIEFVYPCCFWLAAAFRPEDAARVQAFNDLAWLPFLGVVCTGMFQMAALGVVTLRDPREDPVYPRWFAFFQIWCAFGVACTAVIFFFKTGPLAWNGVVGFWIPVFAYFGWVVVTTIMTARAIYRDDEADFQLDSGIANRFVALEADVARLNALLTTERVRS
jgi:hypothetical protein